MSDDLCRIEQSGVEAFDLAAESVDLILTDPPYPGEFLWTWGELAKFAARVLKPGGSVLAMSGQTYLPRVIASLDEHLDYRWTLAYAHGLPTSIWPLKLGSRWKPLLWYSKGPLTPLRKITTDRIDAGPRDKRFHKWGQDLLTFDLLVRRFSHRGDLICDPFLGGGTTALAARVNGRRFAGCDVDEEAIRLTLTRLEGLGDYRRARIASFAEEGGADAS